MRPVFLYILEDLRTGKLTLSCDHSLSYKELVVMSKYCLRPVGELAHTFILAVALAAAEGSRDTGAWALLVERPQVGNHERL